MARLLKETLAWDMQAMPCAQGSLRGGAYSNAGAASFNSAGGVPVVTASALAVDGMPPRVGSATIPDVSGTGTDLCAGIAFGQGLTDAILAARAAGKAYAMVVVLKNPADTPYGGDVAEESLGNCPLWRDEHTAIDKPNGSQGWRDHSTGVLQSVIVEAGPTRVSKVYTAAAYLSDLNEADAENTIGLEKNRLVRMAFLGTPADPLRVAEMPTVGHTHNIACAWVTTNPDGSLYSRGIRTHYEPEDVAANAWNTDVENTFVIGRSITLSDVTLAYRGNVVAAALVVYEDAAWDTDIEEIHRKLDLLFDVAQFSGEANIGSTSEGALSSNSATLDLTHAFDPDASCIDIFVEMRNGASQTITSVVMDGQAATLVASAQAGSLSADRHLLAVYRISAAQIPLLTSGVITVTASASTVLIAAAAVDLVGAAPPEYVAGVWDDEDEIVESDVDIPTNGIAVVATGWRDSAVSGGVSAGTKIALASTGAGTPANNVLLDVRLYRGGDGRDIDLELTGLTDTSQVALMLVGVSAYVAPSTGGGDVIGRSAGFGDDLSPVAGFR